MNILLWTHIAGGIVAILSGTVAAAAAKGSRLHGRAGSWFFGAMLVLGLTAAVLEPFRTPTPGSPVNGIIVCYFVVTAWWAARQRNGTTGRFELAASAVALVLAGLIAWSGFTGASSTPAGSGPVFVFAGLFLLAGAHDLRAALLRRLRPAQRIARHLWRMCLAFFIATGSFFLGQQDVLPAAVRGSPILFVLAFAPFAIMAFWLARVRFAKGIGRIAARLAPAGPAVAVEAAE